MVFWHDGLARGGISLGVGDGEAWYVEANPVTHPKCPGAWQNSRQRDTCTSSPMWMTMGAVGYSKEAVFNVSNAHVVDSDSECQIL